MTVSGAGANNNNTNNIAVVSSSSSMLNSRRNSVSPLNNGCVLLTPAQQMQQLQYLQQVEQRSAEEYAQEVYENLYERQLSANNRADLCTYLSRQPDIEEKMRLILLDWLVDVALKFKQRSETFHLTVDVVDRYLTRAQVSRGNLQLVGITANLIAAKHEEIWAPTVAESSQITAGTYSKEDVIRVERDICGVLKFRLTLPTAYHFAIRLQQMSVVEHARMFARCNGGMQPQMVPYQPAAGSSSNNTHQPATMVSNNPIEHLFMFFLELAVLHYPMLCYLPSTVALAAMLLARMTYDHRRRVASGAEAPIVIAGCVPSHVASGSSSSSSSGAQVSSAEDDSNNGEDNSWLARYLDENARQFCRIECADDIAPAVRELLAFANKTLEPDFRFKAVHRKYSSEKYCAVSREPICLPALVTPQPQLQQALPLQQMPTQTSSRSNSQHHQQQQQQQQ